MKAIRKVIACMLALAMFLIPPTTAYAAEIETSEDDCILLTTFYIPLPATVSQNGTNGSRSSSVDEEIGADISIYQLTGTNKIRTEIEVQSRNFWSGVQISRFSSTIQYTNYTDFSIPDCLDTLTKTTTSPTNSLKGTKDSSASFISGHTIAVTVTINDVQIVNAESFDFTPASYSVRVTIR